MKLNQEEIKQAQDDVLKRLDIMELTTGGLTINAYISNWNDNPVYGRIMMTSEHAAWLQEVLTAEEGDEL